MASAVVLSGCNPDENAELPVVFLGYPENETSGEGPVGLISGVPMQIDSVSKVQDAPYADYLAAKEAGNIVVDEEHNSYVYWATSVERDIPYDNATAWIFVLERFRSKLP